MSPPSRLVSQRLIWRSRKKRRPRPSLWKRGAGGACRRESLKSGRRRGRDDRSGDTAWMLVSTVLVVLMICRACALFYGRLAQSKNVLSVIMQVSTVAVIGFITWALWGFSLTFTEGPMNAFVGGFDKFFLVGIGMDDPSSVLSNIPEFVFVSFQMTFAAITAALAVGAFAERVKLFPIVIFAILWPLPSHHPLAHMAGRRHAGRRWRARFRRRHRGCTSMRRCSRWRDLRRPPLGLQKEPLPPHSLVLTSSAPLCCGWAGLASTPARWRRRNGQAGLATINTLLATAAAAFSWILTEWITKGKPSGLGFASASSLVLSPSRPRLAVGGRSLVLGLIASLICVVFCAGIKGAEL